MYIISDSKVSELLELPTDFPTQAFLRTSEQGCGWHRS